MIAFDFLEISAKNFVYIHRYAYVDLHQLARERHDMANQALTVESSEDGSQIGVLRVTLHIVNALQYLSLA